MRSKDRNSGSWDTRERNRKDQNRFWNTQDRNFNNESAFRTDNREYAGALDRERPLDWGQGYNRESGHDYGSWGNSNFTQNTSSRELDRINSRTNRYAGGLAGKNYKDDNSDRNQYGDYNNDYNDLNRSEFNRPYDFDDRTWDRRTDESYKWEDSNSRRGLFKGKGPKGYRRSDERIAEDINDRLSDDHRVDASEIEVRVEDGEVTLTGSVNERKEKRWAEEIAEEVSGVTNVENRIRVTKKESEGWLQKLRDAL